MVDWWTDPVTGGIAKFAYDKYQDLKHEDELEQARKQGWYDCEVDRRKRSMLDDFDDKNDPDDKDDPDDWWK